MHSLLLDWLPDVLNDEVISEHNNVNFEARSNMWCFSIPNDEGITALDIKSFLNQIIDQRSKQITLPMTFYVWIDEQAGQLRFSLTSQPKNNLPFGSTLIYSDNLDNFIEQFISMQLTGSIAFQDLKPIVLADTYDKSDVEYFVHIWAIELTPYSNH